MKRVIATFTLLLCTGGLAQAGETRAFLTLESAVSQAIADDVWLAGSQHLETALQQEAEAADILPDPRFSITAGNFPVEGLDIHQEGMTQVSLGIAQTFPRGDSLALASRRKQQLAAQQPMLRRDRRESARAAVTGLWLEAFRAQESIRLIEQDRSLFEQLADAAQAGYASALGRMRQQDLVRAQLELTRLDDRLMVLRQQQDSAQRRLSEWIGGRARLALAPVLPRQALVISLVQLDENSGNDQALYGLIRHHPRLQAFDQRLDAESTRVDLARQKYRPEWGINARYGYRADNPAGAARSDLLTLGVTFDLPRLSANRQDAEVSAARFRFEALQMDRELLRRQLLTDLQTAVVQLHRLNERSALYERRLLPQMVDQADASLTAYNNDDGDFAEAVRSRIAELNARIEALTIAVERQQVIARLNYLLSGEADTQSSVTE